MNLTGEASYEGHLERKNKNQNWWKEYYVVLKGGQLFFYNKDNCQNLFGALELSTLGTFCEPEKGLLIRGYQFSVATPSTVTYLRASTADNRDQWIKSIMAAVTGMAQSQTAPRPINSNPQGSSRHYSAPAPAHEPQVYDSTLLVTVDHEWYWPGKTRDQAEQLLRDQPGNCFLVRDSESSVGAYSLSVGVGPLENKNLLHYIIQKTGDVYILNPAPNERFASLKEVVEYYVSINRFIISPLKNPAYQLQPLSQLQAQEATTGNAGNIYTKEPVTQGEKARQEEETEYVRLGPSGGFAQPKACERSVSKKGATAEDLDENSPQKPPRPNQGGHSEYMNVQTNFKDQGQAEPAGLERQSSKVVLQQGQGGDKGNYIYAAISSNPNANTASNGNVTQPTLDNQQGEQIIIRGDERSTPAVTRFGQGDNFGSGLGFDEPSHDNSCYVNFDLPAQLSTNCNVTEPPKPLKMSKASAKAGAKNKGNKKSNSKTPAPSNKPSPHNYRDYNQDYPVAAAPIGYTDPALVMSQPPPKNVRGVEEYPVASGPVSYNDPCMSMANPPSAKSLREEYPVASGPIGYVDPTMTNMVNNNMAKPPSHGKSVKDVLI